MQTLWTTARIVVMTGALGWLAAATCQASVDVEAYVGGPLGVGRVTVRLSPDAPDTPWGDDRFSLAERNDRVLYPVVKSSSVGQIVRRFIDIRLPRRARFYFLFRGDEPLELTVYTPKPQTVRVVPERDREEYGETLDDWWEAVTDRYQKVYREAEYPAVVENYITANWARRLGRRMPEPDPFLFGQRKAGGTWLAQLMANEGYQTTVERQLVLGRAGSGQRASLPLPPAVTPLPLSFDLPGHPHPYPLPEGEGMTEPIAEHVPVECFYVRFGSFTNYLWFRDFLNKWQGDLGNMVVLRSIDRGTGGRLQQQLALRETKLARVMGPAVIRDVAIIGLDAYLRDGAAMGVLFQANNNTLLTHNINSQRQAVADGESASADGHATLVTLQIAGHDVSYLSSPDGRLRSYYAVDGDFHLVTTSRRMVERFYAAGQGDGPLAAADGFQAARLHMPLTRDDTIFVYLSSAFFENLASPHYRVELDRRLNSIGEMRILKMARLAAVAERKPAQSVAELVDAELLPVGFGQRADGSQLTEDAGGFRDSLRGVPGWMVPVADMPVESITPAEAARLNRFDAMIDQQVGRFVPIVAAIARQPLDGSGLDRITVDARVAPYSATRGAKWVNMLGPAEVLRVAPIEGDVASAEVIWTGLGEPIHLFGGLRDFRTPLGVEKGVLAALGMPTEFVRGYLGAWPRPHLLDRWLGAPSGPPDADGNVHYRLFDVWRRQSDDFFVLSFGRDVLAEVVPQLVMVEAQRPAQIRAQLADPTDRQVANGIGGLGYMRARQTSGSATRFMNSLTNQLRVPPPECRRVAEGLIGGRFVCPLGGEYVLMDVGGGRSGATAGLPSSATGGRLLWASTAATPANRFTLTEIPPNYHMPLLDWFRGMSLEVARIDDAVTLYAGVDMVHQEVTPSDDDSGGGLSLPNVSDLLGGWGASSQEKTEELPEPEPEGPALPEPTGTVLPEPVGPGPELHLPPPTDQSGGR